MNDDRKGETIRSFMSELSGMRRGGSSEDPKPHKLIMILSVVDLIGRGAICANRILFDAELVRQFEANFRSYAGPGDWCQPGPPFFHLRTADFWKHKVRDGRQAEYGKIKRVGGSTQLITDNVDYAYLRDDIFEMLSYEDSRNEVRRQILRLLEEEAASLGDLGSRLKVAFHETFSLVGPAIAQLVKVSAEHEELGGSTRLSRDEIARKTSLGPNYVRAVPRWAYGTGLLDLNYHLTQFGRSVWMKDPSLANVATLWSMHYHMAAPQGPGPSFWNHLVSNKLRPGDTLETSQIALAIGNRIEEHGSQKIAQKTLTTTASVFLGTYSRSDGLGPLGLLEQVEAGKYLVKEPEPPSLWVFAYVLADYWRANWGEVPGVNLAQVTEPGGPGALLLMGSGTVNRYLGEIQSAGLAVVQRRSPPFQLNRNWSSPSQFLERLYD